MSDTLFATLMEKIENPGEKTHLHVPDDWMQGRTVYGGLVAALALKSMRVHVSREGHMAVFSLQTNTVFA